MLETLKMILILMIGSGFCGWMVAMACLSDTQITASPLYKNPVFQCIIIGMLMPLVLYICLCLLQTLSIYVKL